MKNNGLKTKVVENSSRIDKLEVGQQNIERAIDDIKNNHLRHLQNSMNDVHKEILKLSIKQSENSPIIRLMYKAIEYIVLAVIMGSLVIIGGD